jgi:hypothetical protein
MPNNIFNHSKRKSLFSKLNLKSKQKQTSLNYNEMVLQFQEKIKKDL